MAKAATASNENAQAGAGHNSGGSDLSEKDHEVLFFVDLKIYNAALAAKKAADAEIKRVGKVIKSDLGAHGMLEVKEFLKAQTEEGAAELKAQDMARDRARRYAGTPSGYQFDLIEDRTPIVERAAADGRRAGLMGETLSNPFNEASAEGQAYAAAWHEGQGDLFKGIKAKEEEAATAEVIKGSDEGGDLDDDGQSQDAA